VMTVTKQQQARRYAALYGRYPYPDGSMPGGMSNMPLFGAMSLMAHREASMRDEMFWHDFESGRRGGGLFGDDGGRGNMTVSSHVRLRLLQQLLLLRASGYLDEEDEEEWEDDGEEEECEMIEADMGDEGSGYYAEADEREDEPPALRGYSCGRGQH